MLTACSVVLGDHPFSALPKSKGKLEKHPEVFISRGNADVVCFEDPDKPVELTYFIYLRWMPLQEVRVWSGRERPANPKVLFGDILKITMLAKGEPGMVSYHLLNVEVGGKVYPTISLVMDCRGVSAESAWSTGDIASSAAGNAAGS